MSKPEHDPRDIERRLREEGVWLTLAEVATLFGVDHSTAYRWTKRHGMFGWRQGPAGGNSPLECDPQDVLRELTKWRQVHRAEQPDVGATGQEPRDPGRPRVG